MAEDLDEKLPPGAGQPAAHSACADIPGGIVSIEDDMPTYYKANRTDEAWELMTHDHSAFVLFSQIAFRARRTTTDPVTGLGPGQAFIGDFKRCGFTEQTYRTAKAHLQKDGFATFQPTTKGTIATIVGTTIYDININGSNGQDNEQLTSRQRHANVTPTTNKNVKMEEQKNEKKEKRRFTPPSAQEVTEYAQSIGLELDGQYFIDHYAANGWMRGKTRIQDWKACVRTWKKNQATFSRGPSDSGGPYIDEDGEYHIPIGPTPQAAIDLMDRLWPEKESQDATNTADR